MNITYTYDIGRWDTNQHAIADAHPGNLDRIVFPGQDYNNARIMDFQDVSNWQNNKLDRTKNSRMGWSDVSICMSGPVVQDLQNHFIQRWNFAYDEKYRVRKDPRYSRLAESASTAGEIAGHSEYVQQPPAPYAGSYTLGQDQGQYHAPSPQQPYYRGVGEGEVGERGFEDEYGTRDDRGFLHRHHGPEGGLRDRMRDRLDTGVQRLQDRYVTHQREHHGQYYDENRLTEGPRGGVACQMTRSCAKWSHGVPIEVCAIS